MSKSKSDPKAASKASAKPGAGKLAAKVASKVATKVASKVASKVMKLVKAAPAKKGAVAPAKSPTQTQAAKFNAPAKAAPPKAAPQVKTKGMTMPLPPPQVKERRRGVPGSPLRGLNLSMRNANKSANNDSVCREVACEGLATSSGYCRLHYIKNWKMLKRKELILKEGKLNQYIEELVAKYPDKYIEAIKQDLSQDKEFNKVVADLELDEGVDEFEGEQESLDGVIDTVRRDFDDEGESF